jgi:two-component system sensor histidine kinase BarA
MSYRTIKRLLGETSLERKCRFLFGSGLLLLITGSFYFYYSQTKQLVFRQNKTAARLLVSPVILEHHWKWSLNQNPPAGELGWERPLDPQLVETMVSELKPEDLKDYSWELMKAELGDPAGRPSDAAGYRARDKIVRDKQLEDERIIRDKDRQEYQYYGAVLAQESCLGCHRERSRNPELAEGDLIGLVKISFPLARTNRDLAWNNAVLLSTAIITASLAMLSASTIVRYVIVKPVLHLKEVSELVARGSLDQRADIRTGDDFEELSHAFNRMLRHLMTVQSELQHLNKGYENKVDELAQVNLRLYEMNNVKNEFLATMSHELRTPLNSILGFSDVLLNSPNLHEKQRRYVGHIQSSGKHLLNLINDVLDLAKIESGKMELRLVEFSIADLVERLVGSMLPLAEKKNIDLQFEVDPHLPLLQQDTGKLQQILNNLLSNAIKFTPEGGRVRVRAKLYGDDQLSLEVEDTGVGIPLEEQEKIFEKFRQGKTLPGQQNPLTREYEGTGLGLSIIRELTKLLSGEVRLHSEFGKGSLFSVIVPLRLEPDQKPREAPVRSVAAL